MLTFPQFVAQINASLPDVMGAAAEQVHCVETDPDDVEWTVGADAIRAVRQSAAGAMVIPYERGRRHGLSQVVPMDAFGVADVCTQIAEHAPVDAGIDPRNGAR